MKVSPPMNGSVKKALSVVALLLCMAGNAAAQSNYSVQSPNKKIEVKVRAGDRLSYDVLVNGRAVLQDSALTLKVEQQTLGLNPKVRAAKTRSHDQVLAPVVRQKFAGVRENYNELRLEFEGRYAVVFRAYNEGAAYRFETTLQQGEVKVYGEEAGFNFADNYTVYYPEEESMFSHNERQFLPRPMKEIAPRTMASVPAVVDANGIKIAIADSDVEEYPGLWLRGTGGNGLAATFPAYPLKENLTSDRDFRVAERADYIAVTKGTRVFPWRLLAVAERDGDLITNQLVWLLAKPSQLQDTSWIKPGKVAWDWWNANNVYGVDFKSGVNTETYKYYIDFAAKYGLEYIVLDEGWYKLGNVLQVVPEINIEELTAYARQKNVGIILWVVWKTLDDQLIPALDQFEKWGVKGIKVDFMQRDDQLVIGYIHKVSREAAKRRMLVDYHGMIRSAEMTRTWPNLISNEGVRGLEWSKWSADADPDHNVLIIGLVRLTRCAVMESFCRHKDMRVASSSPRTIGYLCNKADTNCECSSRRARRTTRRKVKPSRNRRAACSTRLRATFHAWR